MVKTFKELQEIDQAVAALYAKFPALEDGKFGYAYKRFVDKTYIPSRKEFLMELSDIRTDNAMVDADKALIRDQKDPRGYKYSREGDRKVRRDEQKLDQEWENKEIEVHPFLVKEENVPTELTAFLKEALVGLVIPLDGKASVNAAKTAATAPVGTKTGSTPVAGTKQEDLRGGGGGEPKA